VAGVAIRLGAVAETSKRAYELVSRLRRAAASVSTPGARLTRAAKKDRASTIAIQAHCAVASWTGGCKA
jgi:hypothetical protein